MELHEKGSMEDASVVPADESALPMDEDYEQIPGVGRPALLS
jgi:hypothetical protein